MGTYRQLVAVKVTTREAATLTGVSRATAARDTKRRANPQPERARCPHRPMPCPRPNVSRSWPR